MDEADRHMALLLQKQFDMEIHTEKPTNNLVYHDKKKTKHKNFDKSKSLIDPSWELVDPTPNIHVLFMAFNERFFWNKLLAVSVSWSKRMTSCAGVCSYQGRGGLCKITISEPLLKLRPRKDLVETLLHEMIHALLFVTHNDRDRDGHGPEFHKHMYRINNEAGTNITVYHDFHDEVRLYKQHWWRCNGPCQKRRPYFGMVRRAMNRAPGPNDRWWTEHQHNCGGKFIKVKEPEKPPKKSTKSENKVNETKNTSDIRKFIKKTGDNTKMSDNIKTVSSIKGAGTFGTKNKNGTVVLNPKNVKTTQPQINKENIPKTKSNIVTIKDLKTENNNNVMNSPKIKQNNTSNGDSIMDYSVVRNRWLEKFNNVKTNNETKRKTDPIISGSPKKLKTESETIVILDESDKVNCPVCNKLFANSELNEHLDQCLQNDNEINTEFKDLKMVNCPSCDVVMEENELNEHLDECIKKSKRKPSTSKNKSKTDLTRCEICDTYLPRDVYQAHSVDCLNKFYEDIVKKYDIKTNIDSTTCLVCQNDIIKADLDTHLDSCMGSAFEGNMEEEINDDEENSNEEEEEDKKGEKEYNCPMCLKLIGENDMNKHIDVCLTENNFDFSDFD